MKLVIVAAVAENNVIGEENEIPWYYPEDLKHFKETTMGSPVIMGRLTYESIKDNLGGPLPGRTNIVLTRNSSLKLPYDVKTANSREAAIEIARAEIQNQGSDSVFIIGGEGVYNDFMSIADELLITEIPEAPEGDTYFPEIGPEWREVERDSIDSLSFVRYQRN